MRRGAQVTYRDAAERETGRSLLEAEAERERTAGIARIMGRESAELPGGGERQREIETGIRWRGDERGRHTGLVRIEAGRGPVEPARTTDPAHDAIRGLQEYGTFLQAPPRRRSGDHSQRNRAPSPPLKPQPLSQRAGPARTRSVVAATGFGCHTEGAAPTASEGRQRVQWVVGWRPARGVGRIVRETPMSIRIPSLRAATSRLTARRAWVLPGALLCGAPLLTASGCGERAPLPEANGGGAVTACTDGQSRPCGLTLAESGDQLSCYEGTQRCVQGEWSECGDGTVVTRTRPPPSVGSSLRPQAWVDAVCYGEVAASGEGGASPVGYWKVTPGLGGVWVYEGGAAGAPGAAGGPGWVAVGGTQATYEWVPDESYEFYNPCDPGCRYFYDDGEDPLTAGPTPTYDPDATPDLTTLTGAFSGLTLPSPCRDGLDCQFNQRCVGPVTHASCTHSKCEAGDALSGSCATDDPCVGAICAVEPTCCDPAGSWDATCVARVKDVCDAFCAEIPAEWHDLCTTSATPLPTGEHWCVDHVCSLRPSCCDTEWNEDCVALVAATEGCNSYVLVDSLGTGDPPVLVPELSLNEELCRYAIYSDGPVILGQNADLSGDVFTRGDLEFRMGTQVTGSIEVGGQLRLEDLGAKLLGNAVVHNTGAVACGTSLTSGARFDGGVLHTGGSLCVNNSYGTGLVIAEKDITLQNSGSWLWEAGATSDPVSTAFMAGGQLIWAKELRGDVYAAVAPSTSPAPWTGDYLGVAAPTDLALPPITPYTIPAPTYPCMNAGVYEPALGDLSVGSGQIRPAPGTYTDDVYPPGCYGNLFVDSGGIVKLTAGEYSFQDFSLLSDARFEIHNVGPGSLRINIHGGMTLHSINSGQRFVFLGDPVEAWNEISPARVQWFFANEDYVKIDQFNWVGLITAPNTHVEVQSNSTGFNGMIHAKQVTFQPGFNHTDYAQSLDEACAWTSGDPSGLVRQCTIDSSVTVESEGRCESWRDEPKTDAAVSGFDLAVDVPCAFGLRPQIPLCNHGLGPSPAAGLEIAFYATDATSLASFAAPAPTATPIATCPVSRAVAAGSCELIDCEPPPGATATSRYLVMANPTGASAEYSTRDNWTLYDPALSTCATTAVVLPPLTHEFAPSCGEGKSAQWQFLTWRSELTGDATVEFTIEGKQRDEGGALIDSVPPRVATVTADAALAECTVYGPSPCPYVLGDDFPFRSADVLQVTVAVEATTGTAELREWNVTYSCIDDE